MQKVHYLKIVSESNDVHYSEELNQKDEGLKLGLIKKKYRRCLEIGCESGWFGTLLIKQGLLDEYVGIDIRYEELRRSKDIRHTLIAARGEFLPLRSISFDLIVAFHVLEHLSDPSKVRYELARISAPHAHFALAVPLGYDTDPCHFHHYMTLCGWKRFLKREYGLSCIECNVHTTTSTQVIGLFAWNPGHRSMVG